jgi:hypothetical protein
MFHDWVVWMLLTSEHPIPTIANSVEKLKKITTLPLW